MNYKANIFDEYNDMSSMLSRNFNIDEYNDICSRLLPPLNLQTLLTSLIKLYKVSSTKLHIIYFIKKNGLTMYEDLIEGQL